jgi:hypothetical protein
MARDSKLVFKFTREVTATAATGGLRINNLTATAGITNNAYVYLDAAGNTYHLNRAGSNGLNIGGFRQTLGDAASFGAQADVSAVTNDPAIIGNTAQAEAYVRVTYAMAGQLNAATNQVQLVIEAASDSGTGTAGTDWTAVSAGVNASAGAAARLVPTGTAAAGVFTSTAHGLVVGDIVVFTSGTTATNLTVQKPYFVNTTPSANTFTLSNTLNGSTDATIAITASFVAYATPLQKRIVSLPVAPTTKPWLRVAVQNIAGATAQVANVGVWIQDAFYTVGRDTASIAS